jgi:hypothetical protein
LGVQEGRGDPGFVNVVIPPEEYLATYIFFTESIGVVLLASGGRGAVQSKRNELLRPSNRT